MDTSSSSNPSEGPPNDEKINELVFSEFKQTYTYKANQLEYIDIIESSLHKVNEYRFKPLDLRIAAKIIRMPQTRYQNNSENDEKIDKLKKEIYNFRKLSGHPNIVEFYGLCFNEGEAMICMEIMDMSLYDLYLIVHEKHKADKSAEGQVFPEPILGYITVQILEALKHCKENNFIHRDVKPKNILLSMKGAVKLCDFGESRILKDSLASTFVGTIAYWPPERFVTGKNIDESTFRYDVRSDIWSLGITLTEAAYGRLPFIDEAGRPLSREDSKTSNIVAYQHAIVKASGQEVVARCLPGYSNECKEFMKSCLEKVEQRPKYDALMEKPFYVNSKRGVNQGEWREFVKKFEEDSNNGPS